MIKVSMKLLVPSCTDLIDIFSCIHAICSHRFCRSMNGSQFSFVRSSLIHFLCCANIDLRLVVQDQDQYWGFQDHGQNQAHAVKNKSGLEFGTPKVKACDSFTGMVSYNAVSRCRTLSRITIKNEQCRSVLEFLLCCQKITNVTVLS